jgi:hypothetical protein
LQNQTDVRLAGLHAFSHPRYFYGQLLQVRHFTAEHDYFKGKNWLLNRLVLGWGVACGLDVIAAPDENGSVIVTPGFALDAWGREIVVDAPSKPVKIPPVESKTGGKPGYEPKRPGEPDPKTPEKDTGQYRGGEQCNDDEWVHIVICFKSCESDPEPVMAGGCDAPGPCANGTVREGYTIPPPRMSKLDPPEVEGHLHRAFKCRPFGYGDLAEWITRNCDPCLDLKRDPCVPLANIRRPAPGEPIKEIDIGVRPIIYTLDLLFDLILSQATEPPRARGAK